MNRASMCTIGLKINARNDQCGSFYGYDTTNTRQEVLLLPSFIVLILLNIVIAESGLNASQ